MKICIHTSVDDIKTSVKCDETTRKSLTAMDFHEAIIAEKNGQNRKSVITFLEGKFKKHLEQSHK